LFPYRNYIRTTAVINLQLTAWHPGANAYIAVHDGQRRATGNRGAQAHIAIVRKINIVGVGRRPLGRSNPRQERSVTDKGRRTYRAGDIKLLSWREGAYANVRITRCRIKYFLCPDQS